MFNKIAFGLGVVFFIIGVSLSLGNLLYDMPVSNGNIYMVALGTGTMIGGIGFEILA